MIVVGAVGCREFVCPTIACLPQVLLTYQQPITGTYHLSVSYRGTAYEADCPMESSDLLVTGIKSCASDQLLLTGVDLGHGTNDTVNLTVSIDGSVPVAVTATLNRVLNSRDCSLVCFDHRGSVVN